MASPYPEQPGMCGHCGSADVEPQAHDMQCHICGLWSELDGRAIEGNPHHRANTSGSFPWANSL